LCLTIATLWSSFSIADVQIDFIEGAPKDRFVITNTSQCNLANMALVIDLSKSDGRLIFDTTASGAGVEVFQPFEVTEGAIESTTNIDDGNAALNLAIASLPAGNSASFTIDVDDTMTNSELGNIRVSGSEINNGLLTLTLEGQAQVSATFDANSKATIRLAPCSS